MGVKMEQRMCVFPSLTSRERDTRSGLLSFRSLPSAVPWHQAISGFKSCLCGVQFFSGFMKLVGETQA